MFIFGDGALEGQVESGQGGDGAGSCTATWDEQTVWPQCKVVGRTSMQGGSHTGQTSKGMYVDAISSWSWWSSVKVETEPVSVKR